MTADPVEGLTSASARHPLLSPRGLLLVLLVWVLVGLLAFGQQQVGVPAPPGGPLLLFVGEMGVWIYWALVTPLIVLLGERFPLEREGLARSLPVHVVAALVLTFAYVAVGTSFIAALGLKARPAPWGELFVSRIGLRFHMGLILYTTVLAVAQGLRYHLELRRREVREARLAARLTRARLDALRNQLHPHFLFNALNTLAMLIRESADEDALDVVVALSELLRGMLDEADRPEHTLEEELEFLRRYLAIEEIRFEDRLRVEVDVEPEAGRAFVPRLLLQPLVENALQHGIGPSEEGGTLRIGARCTPGGVSARGGGSDAVVDRPVAAGSGGPGDGRLRVRVEDDGAGWTEEAEEGLGLANVRARLEEHYGEDHRFDIGPRREGGTRVILEIPYRVLPGPGDATAWTPSVRDRIRGEEDERPWEEEET